MTVPDTNFKIIIVKFNDGSVHAVSAYCPSDGHLLNTDFIISDKIYCAYHGYCYNVRNGMTEFGTQVNGILHFPTDVIDGQVFVSLPCPDEEDKLLT